MVRNFDKPAFIKPHLVLDALCPVPVALEAATTCISLNAEHLEQNENADSSWSTILQASEKIMDADDMSFERPASQG